MSAVRVEIVRALVATLMHLIERHGHERAATPKMPRTVVLDLEASGLRVRLMPEVRTLPTQVRDVSQLSVWLPDGGGKVLTVEWEPLTVVTFKRGPWVQAVLDLSPVRSLQ